MSESKKQAVRSVGVTLSAQGIKFIIGLGVTMVLARLLTPSDYGLVAMVAVFTGLIAIFRDGGLSIASVQRTEINDAQLSTLFWINAALGIGLALLGILLSPLVAWFYNNQSLLWVASTLSIPFIFSGLAAQPQAILQRQMRFKAIAFAEIASLIISASVGIAAAFAGWGYWALVTMSVISVIINTSLVCFLCRWQPSRPSISAGVGSILKFGSQLTVVKFIDSTAPSLDNLLIGKYFTAEMVGLYTRAQSLMLLPLAQVMPPLLSVFLPVMSRLKENSENFKQVFLDILKITAFISSFITVFLVIGSDWIVIIILGSQWVEASFLLSLLAGPALFLPLSTLCVASLTAVGKGATLMQWSLVKNFISIFAILAGVAWGAKGVALSLSISSLFLLLPILNLITSKSGLGSLSDVWKATGTGIGICALTCVVMFFLRTRIEIENPIFGLAGLFVGSTALHILTAYALPSSRQALIRIISIISISRKNGG
jgi:O-antigen/teichoic acid export membrane protein